MQSLFDIITGLTSDAPTIVEKPILLNRFAYEFGWTPSYHLVAAEEKAYATIHLVVEHGLEHSAIITFLKTPYLHLSSEQRRTLLNISYNNMVDWHIHVESTKILYVYNRFHPANNIVGEYSFGRDQYERLRSEAFEEVVGRKPSPNVPALDDALINTISSWKRLVSAELDNEVSNQDLASLFNAVIFIRAIEDYRKRFYGEGIGDRVLLTSWEAHKETAGQWLQAIFESAIAQLQLAEIPPYLLALNQLDGFNVLEKQTVAYLFKDFYENQNHSFFRYDFSIMSNHALSRIYEKYIAILKVQDTQQLSIFPQLPVEEVNKAYGAVYTPQYIARFFARYLKENIPPGDFRNLNTIDPAVGSGIFLRSLLEIQCDPRVEGVTNEVVAANFAQISGVDVDANACKATQLSLALLQLIVTGEFPPALNIVASEAIEWFQENQDEAEKYDVVMANPPYISFSDQSEELRARIKTFMQDLAKGRTDTYLAFLKLGIELLRPKGFGLFVVPHSFLLATSASKMRKYLTEQCWLRCVADLSAIPVFGDTGIYVSLIIFQKKHVDLPSYPVTVVKCRELAGKALYDAVRKDYKDNDYYSVFEVSQKDFDNKEWHILPLKENKLLARINRFPALEEFLEVRQGFVSGHDSVFIVDNEEIPEGEEEVYVPFLHDRKMERYTIPGTTDRSFLFPIIDGEKLTEQELASRFPQTWQKLLAFKDTLQKKRAFQDVDWWRPLRTRQPEHLLRPKIVTPHLTIAPKFGIDLDGKYAVSRTPFLFPKTDVVSGGDLLLYFTAVLNSSVCYWYIANHSHVYSRGYTMLEVKTLKKTRVPDPSSVPANTMRKILNLVNDRLNTDGYAGIQIERQLDKLVADLYQLSDADRDLLGLDS